MTNHVYAVIYIAGKLAASIGPWDNNPDDIERAMRDCNVAQVAQEQRIDAQFKLRSPDDPIFIVGGIHVKRGDFKTSCELRSEPPMLDWQ